VTANVDAGEDLSVIVLAYEEQENVGPVLEELTRWLDIHEPGAEIVFVDDGSQDATLACAQRALVGRRARFVQHGHNRGMGAGIKSGAAVASGRFISFLPADGQIPPEAIGVLRAGARDANVDVVFSVYPSRRDGWLRKALSLGVRALIVLLHQDLPGSDGPYLVPRSLIDPAQLEPDSFFLNFELPLRVHAAGLPYSVVEVPCRPRRAGVSKTAALGKIRTIAGDLLGLRRRRTREAWTRLRGPGRRGAFASKKPSPRVV